MNSMNLLPEELRVRDGGRPRIPLFSGLLIAAVLLFAGGYLFLSMEITRLQTGLETVYGRIGTQAAQIDSAGSAVEPGGPVGDSAGPAGERRRIRNLLDELDQCVPPGVVLTGYTLTGSAEPLTPEGQAAPSPDPDTAEITGIAESVRSVAMLAIALEHSGEYSVVEVSSIIRQEEGDFAFTVLGGLSP